ncbi:JAB1/MPN/MOV34 metalloenzyme domain [Dillenia turbinata]|uniref:JAB1/MPN/MOV34 metalloenzyme domain n=1 Tax=Dillenia turbinata TaxID=194707 RepID=A0AAN8YR48_9MAGN
MSLTSVKMSEDVWLTCLTHALSTEMEEIMGLLLGDIQKSKSGNSTALIWGAMPQTRSDRRKDRVEVSPEQMTTLTGRTTRVIGWYHSHPHITVLPSHVDVRTQALYQLLDSGFIGLIFSCFSEDAHKVGRIQVIAFQSLDGNQSHIARPVSPSPVNRSSVIDVDSSLSLSENTSARLGSARTDSLEQDTADSRTTSGITKGEGRSSDLGGFFANADANYLGREKMVGNYHSDYSQKAIVDVDPMDLSDSMQEAMIRSNLDMSGAEYVRKEIPLQVLPTWSLIKLESPLNSFTDLQRVLFEEERAAYNQAISQNLRDGRVHPLTYIHHTSTYQASMCNLSPAICALQDWLRENEIRLAMLAEEAQALERDAFRAVELSSGSPRNTLSPSLRGSPSFGHRDLYNPPESSYLRMRIVDIGSSSIPMDVVEQPLFSTFKLARSNEGGTSSLEL